LQDFILFLFILLMVLAQDMIGSVVAVVVVVLAEEYGCRR